MSDYEKFRDMAANRSIGVEYRELYAKLAFVAVLKELVDSLNGTKTEVKD